MILEPREALFGGSGGHLEAREVIWEAREVTWEVQAVRFGSSGVSFSEAREAFGGAWLEGERFRVLGFS